jgi:hypothetical protein
MHFHAYHFGQTELSTKYSLILIPFYLLNLGVNLRKHNSEMKSLMVWLATAAIVVIDKEQVCQAVKL